MPKYHTTQPLWQFSLFNTDPAGGDFIKVKQFFPKARAALNFCRTEQAPLTLFLNQQQFPSISSSLHQGLLSTSLHDLISFHTKWCWPLNLLSFLSLNLAHHLVLAVYLKPLRKQICLWFFIRLHQQKYQ